MFSFPPSCVVQWDNPLFPSKYATLLRMQTQVLKYFRHQAVILLIGIWATSYLGVIKYFKTVLPVNPGSYIII